MVFFLKGPGAKPLYLMPTFTPNDGPLVFNVAVYLALFCHIFEVVSVVCISIQRSLCCGFIMRVPLLGGRGGCLLQFVYELKKTGLGNGPFTILGKLRH